MQNLSLTFFQTPLFWEDPEKNRGMFSEKFSRIDQVTDMVILPEMFNTGFSMRVEALGEKMDGPTMQWMADSASALNLVLVGSLIIQDEGEYFNRLIWMRPDGSFESFDKRHLFRMEGESRYFRAGSRRLIVDLKGWRVCPMICYDLRFPVWSRNRGDYDVLIYIANWPEVRSFHWKSLLTARAIENQAFVIGVNRIGSGGGLSYSGDSAVIDPWGVPLSRTAPHQENHETVTLIRKDLEDYRSRFQVWKDADDFRLNISTGSDSKKD